MPSWCLAAQGDVGARGAGAFITTSTQNQPRDYPGEKSLRGPDRECVETVRVRGDAPPPTHQRGMRQTAASLTARAALVTLHPASTKEFLSPRCCPWAEYENQWATP